MIQLLSLYEERYVKHGLIIEAYFMMKLLHNKFLATCWTCKNANKIINILDRYYAKALHVFLFYLSLVDSFFIVGNN